MKLKIFHSKTLTIFTLLLFIILLSSDVLPQRSVSVQRDVDRLIREGKELYENGEYEEAKDKFLEALGHAREREELSEVYFYLSLAYYANGQSEKAKENLLKLFEIQPDRIVDEWYCPSEFVEMFKKTRAESIRLEVKRPVVKVKPGEEKKVKKGGKGFLLVLGALVTAGAAVALLGGKKGNGGGNGSPAPVYGSIQVNSTPTGAQVFLDGSNTGQTTSCTLTGVSAGSHTLGLVMEGYEDEQISVSVTAGQTATVSKTLTIITITVPEITTSTIWTTGEEVEIKWNTSGSGSSQGVASTGAGLNPLINQGRRAFSRFQRRAFQMRRLQRRVDSERRELKDVDSSGMRGKLSSNTSKPQGVSGETSSSAKKGDIVHKRTNDKGNINRNSFGGRVNIPVVPQISNNKFMPSGDIKALGLSYVKIELYKGGTFNHTISASTENDGSYLWTVDPSLEDGTDYKIRISSPDDSTSYGESDEFTIEEKSITVTEPTDTTVWIKGESAAIAWTSSGTISDVKIDLYKGDTFNQTIVTSTPNDGRYTWTTVDASLANATDYMARISCASDNSIYGESSQFKVITLPQIEWIHIPAGNFQMGDNFNEGGSDELPVHTVYLDTYYISKYEVTFDQYDAFCDAMGRNKPSDSGWGRGDRPVIWVSWNDAKAFCDWLSAKTGENIHLPTEAQWEKAARGTDQRRYPWGDNSPDSSLAKYSSNKTMPVGSYPAGVSPYGIHDMAGNVFELCSDWYDPNYYSSSPTNNPHGPSSGSVRVERGGSWGSAAIGIRSANRTYDSPSSSGYGQCGFRLCKDVPVAKSITVTEPASSTIWTKGKSADITWTSSGTISDVKIDLYKGGTFIQTIVSSIVNNNSYTWPEVDTSLEDGIDYKVRISSTDDSSVYGESDEFTIEEKSITVTEPTSSTTWMKGFSATVEWDYMGTIDNVKIDLYKGGTFKQTIKDSTPAADKSYTWDPVDPNLEDGTDYTVRVSLVDTLDVYDDSEEFKIEEKSITVSKPESSTTWTKGFSATVEWDYMGTIDNVKIDLYKGGTFKQTIKDSTPAAYKSYTWDPVDPNLEDGTDYTVRVSLVDTLDVYDDSEEFKIEEKSITVSKPESSTTWTKGFSATVEWDYMGTIDNVKIDLYKGGTFKQTIKDSTPAADKSYTWDLVDPNLEDGTDYKVKVSLVDSLEVYDDSEEFEIRSFQDIEWIQVPAGSFEMGDNFNEGDPDELPVHTVYLDTYYISKYEVTFEQYDAFCDATGRSKPSDNGWGRSRWPVINISWNDAKAFCDWLSEKTGENIHLPTEAQWEKAARGTDQRKYPWGSGFPNSNLANYNSNVGKTMPVGSYPAGVSPYGIHDMAGNVWEWCSDWYDANYYSNSPTNNPQGPSSGSLRIGRGGSWSDNALAIRPAQRGGGTPYESYNTLGFRLCKDVPVAKSITVTEPTISTIWTKGQSADIIWTSTGTISNVKIDLYKGGTFNQTIVSSTTNNGSYTWAEVDTSLTDGIDYKVRISSTDNSSVYNDSSNFKVQGPIPDAPSDLIVTAVSSSQIDLSWTDNSNNEDGFNVERKTGASGAWAGIDTVGADVTTYEDAGLEAEIIYYYRVRAHKGTQYSDYSNEANSICLAGPTDLTATSVSSEQIDISWTDNSNNESGFKIERKEGATGAWLEINTVGADVTTYQEDTGIEELTTYYYRVRAYKDTQYSDYSNEASATTGLAGPTDLDAASVSSSQIDLSWKDNSSNEGGFKIERKAGATGMWSEIGTVGADVTTHQDTGLEEVTTYYYRVRAYNASGNSEYSNEASATTGLAAPTDLDAAAVSSSQIDLSWTDNSSNEGGFKIERKTGVAGSWAEIATVGANVTTYQDTGLEDGTTYYYRVRAYNATANSVYSNEDNATTELAVPTSLQATAVSSSRINLSWTDNSNNEDGFKIGRKKGVNGIFEEAYATVGANVTAYQDTGLEDGIKYFYLIRAYKGTLYSAYSNEAVATTAPEIEWVQIPAGNFQMGDNFGEGDPYELPVHTVYLSTYYISKYEVTFDQYDAFCDATGRSKAEDDDWGRGDRPVIRVSWDDAKAFCDWMSGITGENIHLPTEAQWEKAARGTDQRRYPWGNGPPNSSLANYFNYVGKTMPVGSYPAGVSPYGLHDMAGNVNEWCFDWMDPNYYSYSPTYNPQGPSSGSSRVIRGGSYPLFEGTLRSAYRTGTNPSNKYSWIGFRICKD